MSYSGYYPDILDPLHFLGGLRFSLSTGCKAVRLAHLRDSACGPGFPCCLELLRYADAERIPSLRIKDRLHLTCACRLAPACCRRSQYERCGTLDCPSTFTCPVPSGAGRGGALDCPFRTGLRTSTCGTCAGRQCRQKLSSPGRLIFQIISHILFKDGMRKISQLPPANFS